jgi:hypothetical protein
VLNERASSGLLVTIAVGPEFLEKYDEIGTELLHICLWMSMGY